MRQHKYRAYNTKLKKMAQVIAIELDPELGGVYVWGKSSVDFETGEHDAARDFWSWDDCVELEWTGESDKDGKEIYEDDILRSSHPVTLINEHVWPHTKLEYSSQLYKAYWEDGSFKLLSYVTGDWLLLGAANFKDMQVVGNIHETPELLKEQPKQ